MLESQEPKYMIVDENGNPLPNARIANRATGKPIPDDEPLMIFRGKDKHATDGMGAYWAVCENGNHCEAIDTRINQFHDFQRANPYLVKEPD